MSLTLRHLLTDLKFVCVVRPPPHTETLRYLKTVSFKIIWRTKWEQSMWCF